ncbi:MAG: DUF5934 domain-containing protein [Nevskia sp.]|nr:DUF5934 domain-containing protein [Nevskia sp.]
MFFLRNYQKSLLHPGGAGLVERQPHARSSGNEVVAGLAESRRKFMLAAAHGFSLLKSWEYHPKEHVYTMTVTVPYKGDLEDHKEWDRFVESVKRLRNTVLGTFKGMQVQVEALDAVVWRWLMTSLLNPHILMEAQARNQKTIGAEKGVVALVDRETRLSVCTDGTLHFRASDDENEPRQRFVNCITVDAYPKRSYLPLTAWLLNGTPTSPREHVSTPFWAYVNIAVQDPDKAIDRMAIKAAGISRQLISDSPSYRALMSHLVEQQEEVQQIRDALRAGSPLVFAYMGVNLMASDPDQLGQATSELLSSWKKHGFRASPERYVHFPIWLASMPGVFNQRMDPSEKRGGLQRGSSMTTRHVATLAPMQGEWTGTPASGGGLLMLSRRGQVCVFNVQDKKAGANYNFVMIAKSGSGKSFVAQELVLDFLAKNGYAFIIDAGRSYFELCEILGGTNLVFKMDDPIDLNPFGKVDSEFRLKEMMEMLRELVRYMAFPQSAMKSGVDDWQEIIIEHAIEAEWRKHKTETTIIHVADWLSKHADPRAKDISDQLRPYTLGRFAAWFDGTGRKVDLNARMTVVEMDDLKGQGMFRNIVLTMIMQRIAETMYGLGDPSIPKLMMIDEAWSLLADMQSGDFIERAYRTYRKYGGSAGIITQGFNDLTKSAAARAAFENSSWLFALAQKPESLEAAFKSGMVHADEQLQELLKSVHTAPGNYSEIYVKADTGHGVYRFIADAYAYWLFTTAPMEKAQRKAVFDQVQKEHPDWPYTQALAEAVRILAARKSKQDFGADPDEVLKRQPEYVARGT